MYLVTYNPLHLLLHEYLVKILIQLLLLVDLPVQLGHLRVVLLERASLTRLEVCLQREHQLHLRLLDVVVELLVQLSDLLLPVVDNFTQRSQLVLTLADNRVDMVLSLIFNFVNF